MFANESRETPSTSCEALCCKLRDNYGIVDVCIPGGNRGDGLIYEGARTVFKKVGLTTKEFRRDEAPSKSSPCVIVYGGGCFSRHYHRMVKVIQRLARNYESVVIFPSTFDLACRPVKTLIENLPSNIELSAREEESYSDLLSFLPQSRVYLDHALGFVGRVAGSCPFVTS